MHSHALFIRILASWPPFVGIAILTWASAIIYTGGGAIDSESFILIERYLDDRGPLEKVFNPELNDHGGYQARELAYLFDWVDTKVFYFTMPGGFFAPLSGLLVFVASGLAFHHGSRAAFPGSSNLGLLVFALMSVSFSFAMTNVTIYRSSKPLIVPFLLLSLFGSARAWRFPDKEFKGDGSWVTRFLPLWLIGSGLSDRMGFYTSVMLALAIAGGAALRLGKHWRIAGMSLAAVFVLIIYNYWLGPLIIENVSGVSADFAYQTLPDGALREAFSVFPDAWNLVLTDLRIFLGNIPIFAMGLLVLSIIGWGLIALVKDSSACESGDRPPVRFPWSNKPERWFPVFVLGMWIFGLVLMHSLMIVRHPAVIKFESHHVWYYPLPQIAFFAFALLWGLQWVASFAPLHRKPIQYGLILLCFLNLVSWQSLQKIWVGCPWFSHSWRDTTALRRTFEEGSLDQRLNSVGQRMVANWARESSQRGRWLLPVARFSSGFKFVESGLEPSSFRIPADWKLIVVGAGKTRCQVMFAVRNPTRKPLKLQIECDVPLLEETLVIAPQAERNIVLQVDLRQKPSAQIRFIQIADSDTLGELEFRLPIAVLDLK